MALGIATELARQTQAPNAARLERLASTLERGGSVSDKAAEKELAVWARATLRDPGAPSKARDWAETLTEALHLRTV